MNIKNKPARASYSLELLEDRIAPATFTVTNLSDSGDGSLRQAIAGANAAAGADTIVFKSGLTGTIALTTGELDITDDLAIKGPGATRLIIDAEGISRVFNIDDGTNALKSVAISGLSVTNGQSLGNGGGIFCAESLTLKNSVISGNGTNSAGGGIFVDNTGNTEHGTLIIRGCKITSNLSTAGSSSGGGLYANSNGDIRIIGSTISGNRGTFTGGVYANISSAGSGDILIKNTTISGNRATIQTGGASLENDRTGGQITVIGSTIAGNTSFGNVGGLAFDDGEVAISNTIISGNKAMSDAGGIYTGDPVSFTITNSKLIYNSAGDSDLGGGIWCNGGSVPLTIVDCTFKGNTAGQSGGGIAVTNQATVNVTGSTFDGNAAIGNIGGGIAGVNGASINVTKTTFVGNTSGDDGAGIAVEGTGADAVTLNVTKCTFQDGYAGDAGGGLRAFGDGSLTVKASKFINNTAASGGGGLCAVLNGTTDITGSIFKGNLSISDFGGGLYLGNAGAKTITDCIIKNNIAGGSGGGLSIGTGTLVITSSKITGNIASKDGGGVLNDSGTPVQLIATVIAGNIAPTNPDESGLFS